MLRSRLLSQIFFASVLVIALSSAALSQRALSAHADNSQFGPVMQAYLGYLRNEQEVVDDGPAAARSTRPTIAATQTEFAPCERWPSG
jgi:hypothetical protein